MIITSEFFSFNVWEWFLHSSILERTESDLSKINWLRGVILLNPIVLVPWGRFSLCHTPIRPISAFQDQISILIVGCVTTWSRGSHQWLSKELKNDLSKNKCLRDAILILLVHESIFVGWGFLFLIVLVPWYKLSSCHTYQTWFTWLSGNLCVCTWVAWPRVEEVHITLDAISLLNSWN